MKEKYLEFNKNGTSINFLFLNCIKCNEIAEYKGSSGFHDEYSYFYQCPKCKNLEITEKRVGIETVEELNKNGWRFIK